MLINIVSSAILDANLCRIGNIVPTEVSKTRASRYVDLSVESVGVKRIDTPCPNVSVFGSKMLADTTYPQLIELSCGNKSMYVNPSECLS